MALFGPDGTGKSTTAGYIEALCKERGLITHHYHWRPRLLPSLNVGTSEIDVSRPDELIPRSWIISLVTYIYFFCDFFFAYFIKLRPLIMKGDIILYERYYYDILFHPRRYRAQEIRFIAEILARLVPRPDRIVLLYGEPSVISNRKPELSLKEISRQQNIMIEYLSSFDKMQNIDVTNTTPHDVAHMITDVIFSCIDNDSCY